MRLVHLDKRGGTAYEYRNDTLTLTPVPSPDLAVALTGDPDWYKHTVVIKTSALTGLGVRIAN